MMKRSEKSTDIFKYKNIEVDTTEDFKRKCLKCEGDLLIHRREIKDLFISILSSS